MTSILVAGGATGIGRATVRALRGRGDTVLLADRSEAAREVAAEEGLSGPCQALLCDLGEANAPAEAVAAAVDLGGGLDAVIVNVGVLAARSLAEWTVEEWDRTMAVNLRAPFLLAQAAAPHLQRSELGSIVFTASTGAYRGHAGMPAYAASKAALVNLARALADELGPSGVRVNCVCPGWVDTPFNDAHWEHQGDPLAARAALEAAIPLRRQAQPEDVVGLYLFLTSPAAGYITGEAIVIDGGYLAV